MDIPDGFGPGGTRLWTDITEVHENLDAVQLVQLVEACRAKDRLDKLDALLCGDIPAWMVRRMPQGDYTITIDRVLANANVTAGLFKQLLASLRLPDVQTGRQPQRRGAARGSQPVASGQVSSLDRARAARTS